MTHRAACSVPSASPAIHRTMTRSQPSRASRRPASRPRPARSTLTSATASPIDDSALRPLIDRIGDAHVKARLEIETHRDHQLFGQGRLFFNLENWLTAPPIVRTVLQLAGLYGRARREANRVLVRENIVASPRLPAAFDGFTILHISDLHVDLSEDALRHLISFVGDLDYDICCADRRLSRQDLWAVSARHRRCRRTAREAARSRLWRSRQSRQHPHDAGAGSHGHPHDVQRMRDDRSRRRAAIYLAGVDDPHFYLADDIPKVASQIPTDAFSILLSHTPETYAEAAEHNFDLMLSGHTLAASSACPAATPSSWRPCCRAIWATARGAMKAWPAIHPLASAPACSRCD